MFGNDSAKNNISIYRYDGNGSMTSDPNAGINFVIYDCNNMPLIEYNGNKKLEYTYDANGTRISKTVGSNTTYYTKGSSGNNEMETIVSASSTTNRYYIWGLSAGGGSLSGDHLGLIQSSARYYYLKDHLGSVRMIIDKNGKVKAYDDYYPYGLVMPGRSMNMAMADERYKFIGQEQDAETGYGYFDSRYYNSVTGMFNCVDDMSELNPGQSPYVYACNNPLRYLDPMGLDAKDDTAYAQSNNSHLVPGVTVTAKYSGSSKSTPQENETTLPFSIIGGVGVATATAERVVANNVFILGKDTKFHFTGRGLNATTGSKLSAFEAAKWFKIAGQIAFYSRLGMAVTDMYSDFSWEKFGDYSFEMGVDALGTFGGGYGFVMSLYLETTVMAQEIKTNEFIQIIKDSKNENELKQNLFIWNITDPSLYIPIAH